MTAPGTVRAVVELPLGAVRIEAPAPMLVSQRTAEAVIGLPRRTFLEALPAFAASGGEVLRFGRLRLVDPAAFVAWLRSREPDEQGDEHDADDLGGAARRLGLRVAGGER